MSSDTFDFVKNYCTLALSMQALFLVISSMWLEMLIFIKPTLGLCRSSFRCFLDLFQWDIIVFRIQLDWLKLLKPTCHDNWYLWLEEMDQKKNENGGKKFITFTKREIKFEEGSYVHLFASAIRESCLNYILTLPPNDWESFICCFLESFNG